MNTDFLYEERLTSNRTEALFVFLTLVFLLLFIWRRETSDIDILAVSFFVVFCFFFFYSINFRILVIRLTQGFLALKFGIFTWRIPLNNIAGCSYDELPALMKYGGAGIHFMVIRKRYRASFNFLEHPRIVIELERKAGPVREISFSTRRPEELLQIIKETALARRLS